MIKNNFVSLICCLLVYGCSYNQVGSTIGTAVEIHDIQGCDHISPMVDKLVHDVKGVVTQKFATGFTMESMVQDNQPCTSEGIFIYTVDYPSVMIGDIVLVSGKVYEFTPGNLEEYNLSRTEIHNSELRTAGHAKILPEPILLGNPINSTPDKIIEDDQFKKFDINADGIDFYESLEFMRVVVMEGTVVNPRNQYNEIVVLPEYFTKSNMMSSTGALIEMPNDQNPEKIMVKLPNNQQDRINVGYKLKTAITGVLDYSFGNYKIVSDGYVSIDQKETVTPIFTRKTENGLTIATYNVENMSQFDESSKISNLAKQIVETLDSPDILVMNEIMDDSGSFDDGTVTSEKTLQKIVDASSKKGIIYKYSDSPPLNNQDGGLKGGNIRSVILYRSDRGLNLAQVTARKQGLIFENGVWKISNNPLRIGNGLSVFDNSRKPTIWLLERDTAQILVFGIHFISQNLNSPDWGSIQPPLEPEEQKRIAQTKFISNFVNDLLEKQKETNLVIAGDFNAEPWSYAISNLPINIETNITLENQKENFSYIYDGNAFQFDYLFLSPFLTDAVVQAEIVHINTLLDIKKRISDHDPVIAEFELKP